MRKMVRSVMVVLAMVAFLPLSPQTAHAQFNGEAIVECVENAAYDLVYCVDDKPWWLDWTCGVKFEWDVVRCVIDNIFVT